MTPLIQIDLSSAASWAFSWLVPCVHSCCASRTWTNTRDFLNSSKIRDHTPSTMTSQDAVSTKSQWALLGARSRGGGIFKRCCLSVCPSVCRQADLVTRSDISRHSSNCRITFKCKHGAPRGYVASQWILQQSMGEVIVLTDQGSDPLHGIADATQKLFLLTASVLIAITTDNANHICTLIQW